jgi:dinuclear metal center YbgI/SA1388 family protein
MSTTVSQLIDFLDEVAPFKYQESYDNAGLLVGDPNQVITGVITSLDMTEDVVDDAIQQGYNTVVGHHPIIFSGLKSLTGKNYIERTVIKAIKNNISLIAIHTNLDQVFTHGVNEAIGNKLGLSNMEILLTKDNIQHSDGYPIGAGMIGVLPQAMTQEALLAHIKTSMGVSCIKYTKSSHTVYQKIAVCGGAGRFLLDQAIFKGADCFISSDFKYHEFFDSNNNILIADIGHYESEQYTIPLLQQLINNKFSTFAAKCTNANTNPVNYYI